LQLAGERPFPIVPEQSTRAVAVCLLDQRPTCRPDRGRRPSCGPCSGPWSNIMATCVLLHWVSD